MHDPAAVLVLVSVLAAGAGSAEPFNTEILLCEMQFGWFHFALPDYVYRLDSLLGDAFPEKLPEMRHKKALTLP